MQQESAKRSADRIYPAQWLKVALWCSVVYAAQIRQQEQRHDRTETIFKQLIRLATFLFTLSDKLRTADRMDAICKYKSKAQHTRVKFRVSKRLNSLLPVILHVVAFVWQKFIFGHLNSN